MVIIITVIVITLIVFTLLTIGLSSSARCSALQTAPDCRFSSGNRASLSRWNPAVDPRRQKEFPSVCLSTFGN